MSDTPRTDELDEVSTAMSDKETVKAYKKLARTVERELAEAQKQARLGWERAAEYDRHYGEKCDELRAMERQNADLLAQRDIAIGSCNAEELRKVQAENAALRDLLVRTTGSLGLIIKGAGANGPGHRANYDAAKAYLHKEDELVCPTCKSARWAEIHPSKSDPTGYTLYCRRCEEGCVSPARAALAQKGTP